MRLYRALPVWESLPRRPRTRSGTVGPTNGKQIGYVRVSTADQDLTSQRDALLRMGVLDANLYVDHGLTGTNRARPGLREALTAVRTGDTLVVTKLDPLARSVKDARDIADELTQKGVALSLGGSRYDPTDPVSRLLFNVSRATVYRELQHRRVAFLATCEAHIL